MEKAQKTAIFAALILGITIGAGIALQGGIYSFSQPANALVGMKLNKFTGQMWFCNFTECTPLRKPFITNDPVVTPDKPKYTIEPPQGLTPTQPSQ